MPQVSFKSVSDFGLLVIFADALSDDAHDQVLALDRALLRDLPEGVIELVPAMVNLMVVFDPIQTDHASVQQAVEHRMQDLSHATSEGKSCVVDICYETPFAPDLDTVAQSTGLSQDAVINAHLAGDYRVLMFGFAPGYGYMGGVPKSIQLPRKLAAVPAMPAGCVMIAGPQCLITTLEMPTGWYVIGRSPTSILSLDQSGDDTAKPLFGVGDNVTFSRISMADFDQQTKAARR